MEPQEQQNENQQPRPESHVGQERSSRSDERSAGAGVPPAKPSAQKTGEQTGPVDLHEATEWGGPPERSMAIETSQIRGPNEAFKTHYVLVPVEPETTSRFRTGAREQKKSGESTGQNGRKASAEQEERSKQEAHEAEHDDEPRESKLKGRLHHASSGRSLIVTAIVALVCGVIGAWAYSYLFGSGKSSSHKSESSASKSSDPKPDGSSKQAQSAAQEASAKKLLQAQAAWMEAVKDLHKARDQVHAAKHAEEDEKAVLDFLKRSLLSAGRPGDVSLPAAFWAGGQGKDVTLRKAIDATESQLDQEFAERPLAEATVREMLGAAYLNLGDAAQSVKQYERAYELRQALQGTNDPDTAACRNQLAVAYRLAGREGEGGRLYSRSPDPADRASAATLRGSMLLLQHKPADAELKLRESLTIRRKLKPEDWTTFYTQSLLGEALLEQHKYNEAEPLLLEGYRGMKKHQDAIPSADKPHLDKALERLVTLYESWGKSDEALRWRKELETERAARES